MWFAGIADEVLLICVLCALGLGILRVRFLGLFLFFFFGWLLVLFFAGFLVELEAVVMVVVVWLCHDVGCGLVVP